MKFLALISGGKDSIYAIQVLLRKGHKCVGLLYMSYEKEYVDSYMYQTVGKEIVLNFGKCLNLPLFVYETKCKTINKELNYEKENSDEVEELFFALSDIKKKLEFTGVCSGAILSTYQKNRVENVTKRLNLISLSPLWNKNQKDLLKEMVKDNIKAVIVKIASPIFKKEHLTMDIKNIFNINMHNDDNYCGEGGEYESIVLDSEIFLYRIKFESFRIFIHPDETYNNATTFYVQFEGIKLVKK